ncbi:tyrosine-type recombinase/integrase [Nocardia panacis]|uniref:tyrosine-type recombinase/integrase n=1 Tax=Nocardia panacis TaxID=2340916 RepID=UPI001EF075F5|nr:tyrosine-type recombinase/integrase [Nocardia panacis]
MLDAFDRDDPVQIRDYAMLTLVARLGLRSIEVARLEVGDIDWRGGRIILRGKASREDATPMPFDVGQRSAPIRRPLARLPRCGRVRDLQQLNPSTGADTPSAAA